MMLEFSTEVTFDVCRVYLDDSIGGELFVSARIDFYVPSIPSIVVDGFSNQRYAQHKQQRTVVGVGVADSEIRYQLGETHSQKVEIEEKLELVVED